MRLVRRLSLRSRLLFAVVAAVAIALTLASISTRAALRSFLLSRVDNTLASSTEAIGRRLDGDSGDQRPEALRELVPSRTFVQVRSRTGVVVTSSIVGTSDSAATPDLDSVGLGKTIGLGPNPAFRTVRAIETGVAPFRVELSTLANGRELIVAVSLDEAISTVRRLDTSGIGVAAFSLAVAAAAGWFLVRVGLRPLREVERTAAAIATGEFSRRVPGGSTRTELGRLATTFNSMVDRIQDAFAIRDSDEQELRESDERMRRFVGDASHELRTPLAAVAAYSELFDLGADQRPDDLERTMRGIRKETSRMGVLVQDLLTLARIDDGLPLAPRRVELVSIAADAITAAKVIDPAWPIRLSAVQPIDLTADAAQLRRVLDNLLANVRAHTPAGTQTELVLHANGSQATITVTDDGPGMTAEQASRVFERFYRVDPSRSRRSGGAGLGLSIADAIVQSHRGTICVRSAPGLGTSFVITLPTVTPPIFTPLIPTSSDPIDGEFTPCRVRPRLRRKPSLKSDVARSECAAGRDSQSSEVAMNSPLLVTASGPPADSPYAVSTKGLTKQFGDRTVVEDLDLAIPPGSVCGLIGPNGAGKTTTIRMLLGLVRPTSGGGTVLGHQLTDPSAYLASVGALIESPSFYPTLSGRANLRVLARLGGIDESMVAKVLDLVGLTDRAGDAYRTYSLGMKQRLGIAAALLPEPTLLVLDEPGNGLDPAGIVEIRALMRSLSARGITIVVSSHLLAEVEQVCDHLVMISGGRLVFQGDVADLLDSQGTGILARTERPEDLAALMALVHGTGHEARIDDGTLVVSADLDWAGDLNRLAARASITLTHLSERRPTLEEAFFEFTGGVSNDASGEVTMGAIR